MRSKQFLIGAKKADNGRSTFQRFMLVFCAFALLLALTLLPVYHYTENAAREAEIKRCETRLNDGAAAIENAMVSLYNMAQSLSNEYTFLSLTRLDAQSTPPVDSVIRIRKTFSGLAVSIPLFSDIGLIVRDDIQVTPSRVFYTGVYDFYPSFLSCGEKTFAEWQSMLRESIGTLTAEQSYRTLDGGSFRALTCAVNWPVVSGVSFSGSVLFGVLPTDKAMRLLTDADVLKEGRVEIRSQDGTVLASCGARTDREYAEITAPLSSVRASVTVQIPATILEQRLDSLNRLIAFYIITVLVIVVLAIIVFAWHSARPMRRLLNLFSSDTERDKWETAPSRLQKDYQFLANNLRSMNEQMREYRDALEAQRLVLTSGIWEKAMTRGFHTESEKAQFEASFPSFPEKWRLAVLRYQTAGNLEENAEELIRLNAAFGQLTGSMYADAAEEGVIAAVMDANREVSVEEWTEGLDSGKTGVAVAACAVSDVFDSVDRLHYAYRQASELLYLPGNMPFVRRTEDRPTESLRVPISIPDTEMLYNALRTGQSEVATHILSNCVQELEEGGGSAIVARFIYNQIANVLARVKLENLSELFSLTVPLYSEQQQNSLFRTELPECVRRICEFTRQKKETEGTRAVSIIRYVDEHLSDPQLSVATLADTFRISSPTLQKLVRGETGMTLAAYIDEKRNVLAAQMLQSGMPVSDVAEKCGYTSVNSFYKAFKRHNGVAPSQLQE